MARMYNKSQAMQDRAQYEEDLPPAGNGVAWVTYSTVERPEYEAGKLMVRPSVVHQLMAAGVVHPTERPRVFHAPDMDVLWPAMREL